MNITRKHILAIGLIAGLSLGTFNAAARLEVSASVSINAVSDFYEPLGECGAWVEVGSYGRCWRPAGVAVGWRPYCAGDWVWTDCGWFWESDEPWAWACYHYGFWIYDPHFGWVWLPGVEWGPAWVSWRIGGGYIGWAPLAPRHVRPASVHFVFVQNSRFCDRVRPSTVIVNNTTIINQTAVVGGIKHETRTLGNGSRQKVVVNEGPKIDVVEKAAGKKLKAMPVREVAGRTHLPPTAAHGQGRSHGHEAVGPADRVPHKAAPPTDQPSQSVPGSTEKKHFAPPAGNPSEPPAHEPPGADRHPGKEGIAPREPRQGPGQGPGWLPSKRQGHDHRDKAGKQGKDKR